MTIFAGTRFVIAVPSLSEAITFYRDRLGCSLDFVTEGWAFLSRDSFSLMIGECAEAIPPLDLGDHSYFAYIQVTDIDGLHANLLSKNINVHHPIGDRPWGMREFGIRTPDGHRIMFGQPLNECLPQSR